MLAPLLAGLSLASGGTAADTLYGRILAEDGRGLPGAEISLAEARRSLVTDAEGRFVFAGLGGGTYSMAIRARGFAAETRRVEVHGKAELTVRLHPSPFQIEPIVVTAGRSPAGPLANPLSSSTLSADALRRRQSVSVAHAIERLPGIRTLSTGSQIGKPVIRGLSGQRVLALDNGIRLEDYSWSDEDGPSIDARLADRIEVVRGPQSLEYGSDALGGVVNAISADLPDAAGGPGFHRGSVELYGASNNAEVGTAVRFEGAKQRMGWRIFGVGRRAASLHTPEGELDNTGYLAINGDAALTLRNDHGGMEFRIAHYGGEFHLLEAGGPPPGSPPGEEAGPVRKSLDDRLQVRADRITTNWHLEARGQFQRHSLIEVSDEAGTAGGGGGETPAFDLLLNTGTLDLVAHHVPNERFPHTVGISLGAQRNSTRGPIPLVPSASIETVAGFALGEARFGKMSMMGGLRFDARHLRAEENATLGTSRQSRNYGAVSGNAGIVFRPLADVALAANIGRAWRAPNLFELFANGPHPGEARYEIGDPALETETATSVEGSIRWQRPRIRGEISAYHNRIGRYIYLTPTSEMNGTLRVYRYLQADADLDGAEASVEIAAAAPLTLRGQVDGVRATNRETGEPLPLTPPVRTEIAAELHTSGERWADRARLEILVDSYAEQTRLDPLDFPTEGYTLVGLEAGVEGGFLPHEMRLDLMVRNVGNTHYRDFLSRYKEFALNPGRDVSIRASLAF